MSLYNRRAEELRRRGRQRADHASFLAARLYRRALLRRAWAIARAGVVRFAGAVRAYLAEALRQAWGEVKARLAVARVMAEDRHAMTAFLPVKLKSALAKQGPVQTSQLRASTYWPLISSARAETAVREKAKAARGR